MRCGRQTAPNAQLKVRAPVGGHEGIDILEPSSRICSRGEVRRLRLFTAALVASAMACRAAPGPLLEEVDPGVVFDDESAQLTLRGAFQVPVEANLDNPRGSTVDA